MIEDKIREIIKNSELYYTAGKLIDSESFDMMIDELVEDLSKLLSNESCLQTK